MDEAVEIRRVARPWRDQALKRLLDQDLLARTRYGRLPGNKFDEGWVAAFHLLRGGDLVGGIRFEAARLFTLLPKDDSEWQHYRFGAIVEFPIVVHTSSDSRRHLELELLARAKEDAEKRHPGMPLFCLLRERDEPQAEVLEASGFVRSTDTCIDGKLLMERGLSDGCEKALVYRLAPSTAAPYDPLALLTKHDGFLRIFSNQETKVRLVPTLEFWSEVKAYTNFSAYPLIRKFLEKFLATIKRDAPARVLVAPCAAGDFLRFWPPTQPLKSALGLDIRQDFVDLARIRLDFPQIDQLNLALCQMLSRIVSTNRVAKDTREGITEILNLFREAMRGEILVDLSNEATLRLFARSFDEVLRNRAVPDWYFPIKTLAGSLGVEDSVSPEALCQWLATQSQALGEAVRLLAHWMSLHSGTGLNETCRPGMATELCEIRSADLIQPQTVPDGLFDIVLCWEFIHVFHSSTEIDQFLSLLIERVAPGGAILITCIRESKAIRPQELLLAEDFFKRNKMKYLTVQMDFSGEPVPFSRRLRYYFPALIVNR